MQSDLSRLIEQKHKLGGQIFEHYEFGEGWEKKKWMRWKTFDRLYNRYRSLDRVIDRGICDRLNDDYFGKSA